jgi:hypothetical protein
MQPGRLRVAVLVQVPRQLAHVAWLAADEEGVAAEQLAVHRNVREQQRHAQCGGLGGREIEALEGRQRDEGRGAAIKPRQFLARDQPAVPHAAAELGCHAGDHPFHLCRAVARDVEPVDQPFALHALEELQRGAEILVRVVVVGRDQVALANWRFAGRPDRAGRAGCARGLHRIEDDARMLAASEMPLEVLLAAPADEHHVGRAAGHAPEAPVEPQALGAAEVRGVVPVLQVVDDHDRIPVPPEQRERQEVVREQREHPLARCQRPQPVVVVEQYLDQEPADAQEPRRGEEARMQFADRLDVVALAQAHPAQQQVGHVQHAARAAVEADRVVEQVLVHAGPQATRGV